MADQLDTPYQSCQQDCKGLIWHLSQDMLQGLLILLNPPGQSQLAACLLLCCLVVVLYEQ